MSKASDLTHQLLSNVDGTGFLDAWFYHLIEKQLEPRCGSPIEILLGAALLFHDKFDGMPGFPLILGEQKDLPFWGPEARVLIPQYQFENCRVDWVYRDGDLLTFIECDGHDFHERTKQQAAKDRQRDRQIQSAGHPILRFTGSEICRDPLGCAAQISEFVGDRHIPEQFRKKS